MGSHIDKNGQFQSDKYPTCPAGKVPLSVEDKTAQPLLWQYAQIRRGVDAEFAADLETALKAAGYVPAVSAHHGVMFAERTIDFYGGPTCDQKIPRWHCQCEGDKGDSVDHADVVLSARTFPAGTRIEISVPVCPACHVDREACRCGFDWDAWDERYA